MSILKEGYNNSGTKVKGVRRIILIPIVIVVLVIGSIIGYSYYKPYSIYNKAMQSFNSGDYVSAEGLFNELGEYKDSVDMGLESKYNEAERLYGNSEFKNARGKLNSNSDSKHIQELISKIDTMIKYQGNWGNTNKTIRLIFDGFTITPIFINEYIPENYIVGEKRNVSFDDLTKQYIFIENSNNIIDNQSNEIYYKFSNSTEFPKLKTAPKIGMTAEEVKSSTWGSPNKVNKTTNSYSVSEQWVYSGGKYLYLDDGIVTSIQE